MAPMATAMIINLLPVFAQTSKRMFATIVLILCLCTFVARSEETPEHLTGPGFTHNNAKDSESLLERYVPSFLGFDRSLIGRADDEIQILSNNAPKQSNINQGDAQYWSFPKSALQRPKSPTPKGLPSDFETCPGGTDDDTDSEDDLRKRQAGPNVFISLNTCDQPSPKQLPASGGPNQLQMFVSTSASNQKPSANKNDFSVVLDGGYGSLNLTATGDVYIGVAAQSNNQFNGIYNYEIAVSIDDYYAKVEMHKISRYIDSDKQSALIYTNSTTSCNASLPTYNAWLNLPPPFNVFVSPVDDPSILGLQNSMCGLKKHALVQSSTAINSSMTIAGGGQPKQQFYIQGLNASTSYYAIVGLAGTDGNNTSIGGGKVNGGGTIWSVTPFATKSSPNCAVIYDLDFCSEVAYAVPSNSTKAEDLPGLRATYDNFASSMYQNFTYSLQQIPCNTTASAQYSLAVSCTDCASAYKDWLCAVTIPRCEDFSNGDPWLQPRAVASKFIDQKYGQQFADSPALSQSNKTRNYMGQSRNPIIDTIIKPGPYKELLPCEDLCYGLVRSCPASLGFVCPLTGHGLNYTYGKLESAGPDQWRCNFPGVDLSPATRIQRKLGFAVSAALIVTTWALFS